MYLFGRQFLYLNVSECALCVDLVLLCISTFLYNVKDSFNKVVLDLVIRKIKVHTQILFSLFIFDIFVLLITVYAQKLPM